MDIYVGEGRSLDTRTGMDNGFHMLHVKRCLRVGNTDLQFIQSETHQWTCNMQRRVYKHKNAVDVFGNENEKLALASVIKDAYSSHM